MPRNQQLGAHPPSRSDPPTAPVHSFEGRDRRNPAPQTSEEEAMTTTASPNENRRSGLTTVLEVAMVLVGLTIGAVFFTSIWSEKASAEIQARFGPSAVVRAS
jgi:hypothetical protein